MNNQEYLQRVYLDRVKRSVIEGEQKVKQLTQELKVAESILRNAKQELKNLEDLQ